MEDVNGHIGKVSVLFESAIRHGEIETNAMWSE